MAKAMVPDRSFHCEVEKPKEKDERGNQVTAVKCHGRLVSETASAVKEVVKPLIPLGGRIGLGVLVGLKASAINQGYCILEFANMTPRVLELLRLTHLTRVFSA